MSLFDLLGISSTPDVLSSGGDTPSIGDVGADFTNIRNIAEGKAKSADYGAATGAVVGAFFGAPQQGADIGRVTFPILNKTVRPLFSNLWDSISK